MEQNKLQKPNDVLALFALAIAAVINPQAVAEAIAKVKAESWKHNAMDFYDYKILEDRRLLTDGGSKVPKL